MARRYRIALLIESSRGYGRGLLRGIATYARTHGPWSLDHQERSLSDAIPKWLENWQGDGILARADNPAIVKFIRKLGIPAVDLRGSHAIPGVPRFETNDALVIQMAVEHLRARGFRRFAYCGYSEADYSVRRRVLAEELLAQQGAPLEIYESPHTSPKHTTPTVEAEWLVDRRLLLDWLSSLPSATGVIACNDVRGRQVLEACREVGIAVPDQLAVIGVDNDDVLCELADPPLTSVEPDTARIGYAAAEQLAALLAGESPPPATTFFDPIGVVNRRSTDVYAVDDREVAGALAFIREHATEGVSVTDVAKHVHISRATLERRFRDRLSTSPGAELQRVRLAKACDILASTDHKLSTVATLCGFRHAEYLSAVFREKFNKTPGQWRDESRKQNRPRGVAE